MTEPTSASRVSDHWWWRPKWGIGTRWYTWHWTFQRDAVLHAHAEAWRKVLAQFPSLDPVPDQWLHMTGQGVGRVGDIAEDDVNAIIEAARRKLAETTPIRLTVDRPEFTPEAVRFTPQPMDAVGDLRLSIRQAIGEVLADVPEDADGFVPHITIGYGNRDADAAPIIDAIAGADIPPAEITVTTADLIVLGRDERRYEWDYRAQLPLGTPRPSVVEG